MSLRSAALAIMLATSSMAAQAATYIVTLTGTVTSQAGSGTIPDIAIGDTVTMNGRFNSDHIYDDGTQRFGTVYGLPTSGDEFWKVTLNDITWKSVDDFLDGSPYAFNADGKPLQAPFFELLPNGKIGTPVGFLEPVDGTTPVFDLNKGEISPPNFGSEPTYGVTWDLAGSSFAQVPEPATWAMTLVGFGLIGTAARRRGRVLRSTVC
jgi:hypothetical protein